MTFDEWRKTQTLPPDLKDWPPMMEALMRKVWSDAQAEQREADAKVCEGYALRTRGYLDDDMTACKLADAIRKGGE